MSHKSVLESFLFVVLWTFGFWQNVEQIFSYLNFDPKTELLTLFKFLKVKSSLQSTEEV